MPIYCANPNSYGKNRPSSNNNYQCLLNSSKKYTNNLNDIFGEYSSGNIHYQQHNGTSSPLLFSSALNNPGNYQSGTMPAYLYHHLPKQTNTLNNGNASASNGNGNSMANNINNNSANNNGNGANSKTSTSLIMAINRFKNSVKDMKETVLIPTRLSDLLADNINNEACELLTEDDYPLSTVTEESSSNESDSYSNEPFKHNHIPQHQNLYEQFKLFDLIDRILSFDNILMVSLQQQPLTIRSNSNGHFAMENGHQTNTTSSIINDNNNNPSKKLLKYIEENNVNSLIGNNNNNNGLASKLYFNVSENDEQNEHYHLDHPEEQKNEMSIITNRRINNNDNNNNSDNNTNGKILKSNHDHHHHHYPQQQSTNSALSTNSINDQQQPQATDTEEQTRSNSSSSCSQPEIPTDDISQMDNINDYPVSDCSLLKMYEKFKYHLLSLKSILNVMSDGAEYITQTYLDDIKSGEGRFDNSKRNSTSFIDQSNEISSTRHYYTSN